jgi:hypothetical protein
MGTFSSSNRLSSWGELGGICPRIVGHWVSQMVRQVFQGALSSHNGLHEKAKGREHCQSAILQLLHLQFCVAQMARMLCAWMRLGLPR